jgi:hypothetical protein
MTWQRIVGWQLLLFGGVWCVAVAWFRDPAANVLGAVPNVAQALASEPHVLRAVQWAPYAPALVAVVLGLGFVWNARRGRTTLAQQFAHELPVPSRRRAQ